MDAKDNPIFTRQVNDAITESLEKMNLKFPIAYGDFVHISRLLFLDGVMFGLDKAINSTNKHFNKKT